jgi:DNA-directed RNA polymerase specialized sigma subunit
MATTENIESRLHSRFVQECANATKRREAKIIIKYYREHRIRSLRANCRRDMSVFFLRKYVRLKHQEIASMLGMSASRVQRVLARMRWALHLDSEPDIWGNFQGSKNWLKGPA